MNGNIPLTCDYKVRGVGYPVTYPLFPLRDWIRLKCLENLIPEMSPSCIFERKYFVNNLWIEDFSY